MLRSQQVHSTKGNLVPVNTDDESGVVTLDQEQERAVMLASNRYSSFSDRELKVYQHLYLVFLGQAIVSSATDEQTAISQAVDAFGEHVVMVLFPPPYPLE
jgi:CMP-2-keto-3-deoxyoctulosonic acid synthetase